MTSFTELYFNTTAYLKKYSQLILAILFVILGLANCFLSTDLSRNTGSSPARGCRRSAGCRVTPDPLPATPEVTSLRGFAFPGEMWWSGGSGLGHFAEPEMQIRPRKPRGSRKQPCPETLAPIFSFSFPNISPFKSTTPPLEG